MSLSVSAANRVPANADTNPTANRSPFSLAVPRRRVIFSRSELAATNWMGQFMVRLLETYLIRVAHPFVCRPARNAVAQGCVGTPRYQEG